MATEADDVHCGDGGATTTENRISGLPDDLLQTILLRLRSTPDAARTSVLGRRWRHLWAALRELSFPNDDDKWPQPSSQAVCRRIDAALAACSAPTVDRLEIAMPRSGQSTFTIPGAAAGLLRFASQRLTGELRLSVAPSHHDDDVEGLVLPPCPTATAIRLDLCGNALRFGPPASSGRAFAPLSTLSIEYGRVDIHELEDVVSSRCPSLKKLTLGYVFFTPIGSHHPGLCIRSDSLERLVIFGNMEFDGRLVVDAPKLRSLSTRCTLPETRIVAPMLSEVYWHGYPYDPRRHRLVDLGRRHIQRLDVQTNSPAAALMELFDTVSDLNLTIDIREGIEQYGTFLKNIDNVPKCEILLVRFIRKEHAFMSTMLYLLKKCTSIRKLEVFLASGASPCSTDCPCRSPESCATDSITLDSLKEVEIYFFKGSAELLELIELLSSNAVNLQKIVISYESSSAFLLSKEVCNKARGMCHPNIKVEFNVLSCHWERVRYYHSSQNL